MLNNIFNIKKRIVIKIGSSLLVRNGEFATNWLKSLSHDIANIQNANNHKIEFVIITSGAVALGKEYLVGNISHNANLSLSQKQAAAAIGQIQLMSNYHNIFNDNNLKVAQILLTASDCNERQSYKNAINTITTLINHQFIPIINENDSVAVAEIKIGDNDRLAARVAQMIDADLLILFSDIDGLYSSNPRENINADFVKIVTKIDDKIESMAGNRGSDVGTGGMKTKIMAAKIANSSGCDVIITSGIDENCLSELSISRFINDISDYNFQEIDTANNSDKKFTLFQSHKFFNKSKKISRTKKNWLTGLINLSCNIIINKCAVEAIKTKKNSLLPIGVIAVNGVFKAGEAIAILDNDGRHIGNGIVNYDSNEIKKILSQKTGDINKILGKVGKDEIINLEYLAIF